MADLITKGCAILVVGAWLVMATVAANVVFDGPVVTGLTIGAWIAFVVASIAVFGER